MGPRSASWRRRRAAAVTTTGLRIGVGNAPAADVGAPMVRRTTNALAFFTINSYLALCLRLRALATITLCAGAMMTTKRK
jgi:hypothetical protein